MRVGAAALAAMVLLGVPLRCLSHPPEMFRSDTPPIVTAESVDRLGSHRIAPGVDDTIRIVRPDPNVDYKIRIVCPDPDVHYTIRIVGGRQSRRFEVERP